MDVQWLSTKEWAEKFNMHPQQVRNMCLSGQIKAEKIGKSYRIPYIDPPDIQAEQRVMDAVEEITRPCVAVIDATIESLKEMKGVLERAKEI